MLRQGRESNRDAHIIQPWRASEGWVGDQSGLSSQITQSWSVMTKTKKAARTPLLKLQIEDRLNEIRSEAEEKYE